MLSYVPGEAAPEFIGHFDITTENVVFRDTMACALIDFDLAKPATRVDEVFNALRHWGQIADPVDVDVLMRGVDVPRRCRIFADAYGLSAVESANLVEVGRVRLARGWHFMKGRADVEGGGWMRMWNEGGLDADVERGCR